MLLFFYCSWSYEFQNERETDRGKILRIFAGIGFKALKLVPLSDTSFSVRWRNIKGAVVMCFHLAYVHLAWVTSWQTVWLGNMLSCFGICAYDYFFSYCSARPFSFDTELIVSPFNFSGLIWLVCPDYVPLLTESVWLMLRGCRVGFVLCRWDLMKSYICLVLNMFWLKCSSRQFTF